MKAKEISVFVVVFLSFAMCVPPSPTSAVSDLKVEFATMQNTIKVLSDQWEKWNTLFLTSLEPRITSTASTLVSIDSNIHNLQERAHVWDTFQLHVSAWNEQLASLDRKIDIISKGQEKVLNLDGKINAILNMEHKLDNTMKILNNIYDSTANLDTTVHSKKAHDVLFNEFATRGVLSSIKLVEKKLDRLLVSNQNSVLKQAVDEQPKFSLKCNTPKALEDLLKDISSKVDVIYDGVSGSTGNNDETDYSEYTNLDEGSETEESRQDNNKRLKKTIRRIVSPCKQMNHALEEILSRAIRIENTSLIILDKENTHFEKLTKNDPESKCLESVQKHYSELAKNNNHILASYFNEQRAQFESISNRLIKKPCYSKNYDFVTLKTVDSNVHAKHNNFAPTTILRDRSEVTTASTPSGDFTSTQLSYNFTNNLQPTWMPVTNQNMSSCEDLNHNDKSGVYIFNNNVEQKGSELFYNKRYCEMREDSSKWTVIQRRDNFVIQYNFNVSWENYKYGFGDLHKDFWMGNEFLSMLSNKSDLILRIELEDFDNHTAWAEYDTFRIYPEYKNYRLGVGGYTGNATDSFSGHDGSEFSTYDRVNDNAPECCPCAVSYGGGWWFNRCFESNLNGVYYRRPNSNNYFRGIIWEHWLGNYSLKKTVMMVKSKGDPENYPSLQPAVAMKPFPYYEDP